MRQEEKIGRSAYLEQALRLIDERGGSQGVNLREVARALGRAHTNAYNYFHDLPDLLGQALAEILERQFAETGRALAKAGPGAARRLERLVQSQVDFALAHPGWYRFAWLEPLDGPPPARAEEVMRLAGEELTRLFEALSQGTRTQAQARRAAGDFHDWLHGALSKVLTGRVVQAPSSQHRRALMAGARRMVAALGVRAEAP